MIKNISWSSCKVSFILFFSKQFFEKYSNVKFNENPSIGSRVLHADWRIDTMKLTVAFRNFTKTPKDTKVSTSLSILLRYNAFYPFIIYTFRPISAPSFRRRGYVYHKLST